MPHKVPIFPTHLQPSIPTCAGFDGITITSDVGEGVTAPPMIRARPSISLQRVSLGELIPGADQFHGDGRRGSLARGSLAPAWLSSTLWKARTTRRL